MKVIPEQHAEHSQQALSVEKVGRFRWLIAPERRQLLLPLCGLWILALDWLLFSPNALSVGLATPVIVVIGFLLGAAGTFYLQRRFSGDNPWKAVLKAMVAGIVVGLPWPLAGTLIGGWVLLISGVGKAKK
jgi:hypothetical protein